MTESRACAAQGRLNTQATSCSTHARARGGGDPDEEPSGSSGNEGTGEYPQSHTNTGSSRSNQRGDSHVGYADLVVRTGPARNTLDQDYARRSTSARPQQPQQLEGLTLAPNHAQGQSAVLIVPSVSTHWQAEANYESTIIETLIDHIREFLADIPDNLPELKGLWVKLPEAYKGEDNFKNLDVWLQGLLWFLKVHHLTGTDKDRDQVLITGTCLKGKAERWFSHEVERPNRLMHHWTFESIVVELYCAFITTATAQKAMGHYEQISYLRKDGVFGFYRELRTWAARIAQYPDLYSFKRKLFNRLLDNYRCHLVIYDKISAEHSTLDEIVGRARDLEKVLASVEPGRGPDRQGMQSGTATARRMPQRTAGAQIRCPEPRQMLRDCEANLSQPTLKGDTSMLTCYRCGKVGHIASDTKCLQYKKPEQQQIYVAQVVDDRSDDGQSDHRKSRNAQDKAPESGGEKGPEEGPGEHQFQDDCLDGSQYDGEGSPYDDYDGYALPSDDEEHIYIRAMSDDEDASSASNPTQFNNVDWKSRHDILRGCYQQAPYLHGAACEFTPWDGITHPRACETCANYKKHLLVAEAINRLESSEDSSAWKVCDKYEQELIRLGWDLAHEGGHVLQDASAVEALACRNHQLTIQLGAVRNYNAYASREYKRLVDELECAHLDAELCDSEADC